MWILPESIIGDLCRDSIKTWKTWLNFFLKFQFMFILAIRSNGRHIQCLDKQNIVLTNKTSQLFLESIRSYKR